MTKRAATLSPSQLRHLLRVTEATSHHPERDVVILWLSFGCGMRVTEIARLTVADIMLPSGLLRQEISLRAEITKGCRQRLAYLTNPKLIAAMERYIAWRKAKDFGCSLDGRQYRGLMPETKLPPKSCHNGQAVFADGPEKRPFRSCPSKVANRWTGLARSVHLGYGVRATALCYERAIGSPKIQAGPREYSGPTR